MKKILGIIILSLLFSGKVYANLGPYKGEGELKLSEYVMEALIYYLNPKAIHNESQGHNRSGRPLYFAVNLEGTEMSYTYCPQGATNCRNDPGRVVTHCEKRSGGKCFIFASKRKIVWNNINYKFKRKSSELEIRNKLEELGFTGISLSSSNSTSNNDDLIENLKNLNELYKSGVLTKEEFEKAKKKILN